MIETKEGGRMKTLGILGGMGAMATVDFFSRIVTNTAVEKDQDHLHIIIENYPAIPDRTTCIQKGLSPIKEMMTAIKRLELCNVDFIAMPCNTAHHFHEELSSMTALPFLNMIEITLNHVRESGHKNLLLLATLGTYESDLYRDYAKALNLNVLYPNDMMQMQLASLIYTYKSKQLVDKSLYDRVYQQLHALDVDAIILGCTELPLIFKGPDYLNPTELLAKACIQYAGAKVKVI